MKYKVLMRSAAVVLATLAACGGCNAQIATPFPIVQGAPEWRISSNITIDTDSPAAGSLMFAGGGVLDDNNLPFGAFEYRVYNVTSFIVDPGVTVSVIGSKPLVVLASGDIVVAGTIDTSGQSGEPGANGGLISPSGTIYGPGGAGGCSAGGAGALFGRTVTITSTGRLLARGGDASPGGLAPPPNCNGDPLCMELMGFVPGNGVGGAGAPGRASGGAGGPGGSSIAGGSGGTGGGGSGAYGNGGGGGGGGAYGGAAGSGGGGNNGGASGANAASGHCPQIAAGGAGGAGGGTGGGSGGTANGGAGGNHSNRRGGGGGGGGGQANATTANGGNGGSGGKKGGGGGGGGGADSCDIGVSNGTGGTGGPGGGAAGNAGIPGSPAPTGSSSGGGGGQWILGAYLTNSILVSGVIDVSGGSGLGFASPGGDGLIVILAQAFTGGGQLSGTIEYWPIGITNAEFECTGAGASGSGAGAGQAIRSLACPCDYNADGSLNSQDFFDFLSGFFSGQADYNNDSLTNSQDFFDFLSCFFIGCSDEPFISSFFPADAAPGDFITLFGSGFGSNPADICALIMGDNDQVAGFSRVVSATDDQVVLRLDSVLPGSTTGRIMLALGNGAYVTPPPPSEFGQVTDPFWVWETMGRTPVAAPAPIRLRDPRSTTQCFYPVLDTFGRLVFTFPSNTCPPGTTYRIQVDACTADVGCYWIDVGGAVASSVPLASEDCADLLCQYYDDALTSQGIPVTCSSGDDGTNTFFRVRRTNGVFTQSSGVICITRP